MQPKISQVSASQRAGRTRNRASRLTEYEYAKSEPKVDQRASALLTLGHPSANLIERAAPPFGAAGVASLPVGLAAQIRLLCPFLRMAEGMLFLAASG